MTEEVSVTECLHELYGVGLIESPWVMGMIVRATFKDRTIGLTVVDEYGPSPSWLAWTVYLDSPSTVGCLMFFFREASKSPNAHTSFDPEEGWTLWRQDPTSLFYVGTGDDPYFETEVAAICAGLRKVHMPPIGLT